MELLVLTVFSTLVDTAELGLVVIFFKKGLFIYLFERWSYKDREKSSV